MLDSHREWKNVGRLTGVVFAVVALLYALASSDYFLFDDGPAITANSALTGFEPGSAAAWRDAMGSSRSGPTGRPLAMFTLALSALWTEALNAIPFKLGNLLLHLACGAALLAFLLELERGARQVSSRPWPVLLPWLTVALWLLAPIHVSTVLYPVQRMAQLSALFVLLGLYLFTRWRGRWAVRGANPAEVFAAGLWLVLIGCLAVFSKENGVLLLWLLPLLESIVFRGRWRGTERRCLQAAALVALVAPVILVTLIFLLAPELLRAGYANRDFTLEERVLTQLRVLWHYAAWLLLPLPGQLGFLHDTVPVSTGWLAPSTTLLAGCGWLLLLSLVAVCRRSCPWLLFGLLFFLIGHSLESSVLALEMVFEHRNYLPAVGLCLLLAGVLCELIRLLPAVSSQLLLAVYFLPLLLLLTLRTASWGDEMRMADDNVRYHPDSPRGHYFLSRAYERRYRSALVEGDIANREDLLRAREQLVRMAELAPDSMVPYSALYLFDERWFFGNPQQADWLAALLAGAGKPVLSASEVNGLSAVLETLLEDCGERVRFARSLLDQLLSGSRATLRWELHRYSLAACGAVEESPQAVLARLLERYPNSVQLQYSRLAAAVESDDVAGMYAVVGRILELDEERKELSRLRTLVAN